MSRKKNPESDANILILILIGVIVLYVVFTQIQKNKSAKKNIQSKSDTALNVGNVSVVQETAESKVPELSVEKEKVEETKIAVNKNVGEYIEVIDSCGIHYGGLCLSVRSGPGTEYEKVYSLRMGIILKISDKVVDSTGKLWYKIHFDEWVRYPDRLKDGWYVSGDYVRLLSAEKSDGNKKNTNKKIVVDRSEQKIYAYDGEKIFMEQTVSTGLDATATPRGTFYIFRKTPSRYMQGPIPGVSSDYYDLPGVPWTMYFTEEGGAIHGAYWHDNFGQKWSHGCVNLPIDKAEILYEWADIGTTVVVRD